MQLKAKSRKPTMDWLNNTIQIRILLQMPRISSRKSAMPTKPCQMKKNEACMIRWDLLATNKLRLEKTLFQAFLPFGSRKGDLKILTKTYLASSTAFSGWAWIKEFKKEVTSTKSLKSPSWSRSTAVQKTSLSIKKAFARVVMAQSASQELLPHAAQPVEGEAQLISARDQWPFKWCAKSALEQELQLKIPATPVKARESVDNKCQKTFRFQRESITVKVWNIRLRAM